MQKIFQILLMVSLLASCKSLVNDVALEDLPVSTPQMVVHGYLSPQDTLITIRVSYSTPAFGTRPLNVGTAGAIVDLGFTVTLGDGSKTITLPYTKRNSGSLISNYEVSSRQMAILEGKTYSLKVTSKTNETVTATCQIPKGVPIKEVIRDSVRLRGDTYKTPIVKIKWQDPKGKGNYYRVSGDTFDYLKITNISTNPAIVSNQYNLNMISFGRRYGDFQKDDFVDGEMMTSDEGEFISYGNSSNTKTEIVSRQIEVVLVSCEKSYYDYHNAIQNYQNGNPFAEPSLIPSNIKGGLGCFAGYNRMAVFTK